MIGVSFRTENPFYDDSYVGELGRTSGPTATRSTTS